MKCPGFTFAVLALLPSLHASNATSPIDYRHRNDAFAPNAGATRPTSDTLPRAENVQDRRIEQQPTIAKEPAAGTNRRAPVDVSEAREKNVREKEARRPDAREHVTSDFNGRSAGIRPASETKRPPTVAKYQDSLVAASASNMARFPALSGAASAKINRFVFRKNGPGAAADEADESTRALERARKVPAAGGAPVREQEARRR